jgi:HupH hydrogenase expression protein, C-terminal conserved region
MSGLEAIGVRVEQASGNITPLLHEIRHALERLLAQDEATAIDLRSLPLAPGELERIEALLGAGEVAAELDALGPSSVRETAFPGVWITTHSNADGEIVGKLIEVTRIPTILLSQDVDIRAGIAQLAQRLEEG